MLNLLVRQYIAVILKRAGFRKKGLTWNRDIGCFVHVIDIQPNRIQQNGLGNFTVNIGVFSEELWNIFMAQAVPNFIKEENCYPRFRLGVLLNGFNGKKRDQWWTLRSEKDVDIIGKEFECILCETCLPFFDGIKSISDFLHVSGLLNRQMPVEKLYHAILLHLCGDAKSSNEIIADLVTDPYWRHKAVEIAARLKSYSSDS